MLNVHVLPVLCLLLSPNGLPKPSPDTIAAEARVKVWVHESWTGSDARFVAARKEADAALKTARDPLALLHRYRVEAETGKPDAARLFRWAYTAYHVSRLGYKQKDSLDVQSAGDGMARCPSPHSYEYDRVRFLMGCVAPIETRCLTNVLVPLGEQLLVRNRNDEDVKLQFAGILPVKDPRIEARALRYVNELIQANPKKARNYSCLAMVHLNAWVTRRMMDDKEGELTIMAFQRYIELGPVDPRYRRNAEETIEFIRRKMQANARSKKALRAP